jgi:hypothetical protein
MTKMLKVALLKIIHSYKKSIPMLHAQVMSAESTEVSCCSWFVRDVHVLRSETTLIHHILFSSEKCIHWGWLLVLSREKMAKKYTILYVKKSHSS